MARETGSFSFLAQCCAKLNQGDMKATHVVIRTSTQEWNIFTTANVERIVKRYAKRLGLSNEEFVAKRKGVMA